jgi:hypothetical protein
MVADALIGRAPEHLDDVASGMFTVKRPSAQQSWVGANQPLVDAAGLVPTGSASKAALLGGPMLKALGKTDEWKHAVDVVRRTGTPPPGWVVHPGKASPEVSVMKYEDTPFDEGMLDKVISMSQNPGSPRVKTTAAKLMPGSEVVEAYNRYLSTHPKRGNYPDWPAELEVRVNPRLIEHPEASFSQHSGISATMGRKDYAPGGVPLDLTRPPVAKASLKALLEHELTHGSQVASNLPHAMRGGAPSNYSPKESEINRAMYLLDQQGQLPHPKVLKGPDGPEDFARQVRDARILKMNFRKETPFDMYKANSGEAVARAMERMAFNKAMAFEPPSPAATNYQLRRQMETAKNDAFDYPTYDDLDAEMMQLWDKFERIRSQQRTKGSP